MIDKGSEFFNRSTKSWLEKNAEDMYSAYNEGKSVVVVEKFIRILKYKICKNMNWVSINVYIDKLYDIVNKYNNKYHNIIRMKLVDVKSNTYSDSSKLFFQKALLHIGPKNVLRLKKLKTLFHGYIIY